MNKLDYLKLALQHRLYQKKIWILSVFSVAISSDANDKLLEAVDGTLRRDNDGGWFVHPETKEHVRIEGVSPDKALFYKHEKITVNDEFYYGLKPNTVTTAGIMLLNKVIFWEPFGTRTPYVNGLIDSGTVRKVIKNLMVDNPKPGETIPEGKASVNECLKVTSQANYLEGCNEIFVKAGSVEALDVADDVIALRDRLLEENKDRLNDSIVVADIIKQVVDADMASQLSGASADFYIDKKFIDNARKKMFLVFGLERDFSTGDFRFIKNSLDEGWDKNLLTHYINTAVAASYDRGKSTGEGGADVNDLIRLTSRIRVTEPDCGAKKTEIVILNKATFDGWVGSTYVKNGKLVKITSTDTDLIGQPLNMRVPQFCQTKEGNFCKTCCGDKLGYSPSAIAGMIPKFATVFMLIKMKNAHVSKVDTVKLSLVDLIK